MEKIDSIIDDLRIVRESTTNPIHRQLLNRSIRLLRPLGTPPKSRKKKSDLVVDPSAEEELGGRGPPLMNPAACRIPP